MSPYDPLILAILLLIAATLAFLLVVGVVNVVYRLVTGRFFRWLGRRVWIAFGIYLAVWMAFLYALFSSSNAFLITH